MDGRLDRHTRRPDRRRRAAAGRRLAGRAGRARRPPARDRGRALVLRAGAPAAHLRVRRAAAVHLDAARGGAARLGRGGPGVRAGLRARRRAVGGARRGLGPVRRRAARRGRHPHRHLAAQAGPARRPREPARVRRAGRHEHRRVRRGRPGPLLPARPELPDRLLHRRQRGRELRRRALLQVRLHHELRVRAGDRAARRRDDHARRRGARPAGLRPARRLRRLGGHARDRHQGVAARHALAGDGQDAGRLLRLHAGGGRGRLAASSRPASCPARSR